MARFCVCGCGEELKDQNGNTDYDRVFFSAACRNKDKAQRIRDQRKLMKEKGRCSKCGQMIQKAKPANA
ncbi:MAG TPA: hypothetical protein VJW20_20460 [Candidatus Angelobacter sp.]|nr:hypothetical protein [Candidatus Angelobacter sp.]